MQTLSLYEWTSLYLNVWVMLEIFKLFGFKLMKVNLLFHVTCLLMEEGAILKH